jgi:hypothetical protein
MTLWRGKYALILERNGDRVLLFLSYKNTILQREICDGMGLERN